MRFRGGEFSTGTKGNFQSELTIVHYLTITNRVAWLGGSFKPSVLVIFVTSGRPDGG